MIDEAVIRRRFLNRWSNIPLQFRDWTLDKCDPELLDPDVWSTVTEYTTNFKEYAEKGIGLLLVGPPGRGKTALGCSILNHVMEEYNLAARFSTLQQYIRDLQEQIKLDKEDNPDIERVYELNATTSKLLTYPLVLLDDVGKEYRAASGYAVEQFDYLLRTRHSNQRPTIITTNRRLKDWDVIYDESMKSYVREACIEVRVKGNDLREGLE